MTITQNWTEKDYLNYIIKNKLDSIWYGWSNPKSVDGIRLVAYAPLYDEKLVELLGRKCTRKGCNGNLIVPLDDRMRKIIYKIVCNGTVNDSACGAYKAVLYRWVSASDQTKLWFQDTDTVRHYGELGRTFYSTLSIYDRRILSKNSLYVNESLMMAHTLGMDIDIKKGHGNICDLENREQIDVVLDIVREQLNTFAGKSYNLQTSGNGVYIFLRHDMVKVDIFNQMARFNSWINYLNKVIKERGVTRIKIDAINMPSRVFKLIGSIHQKLDLVCIPLEHDCYISKMNSDEFKLKNFDIEKYIIDGKLQFYNRYDENDKKSLYDFLEEHTQKHPYGDLRAVRYQFKDSVEIITGEEQKEEGKEEQKEEGKDEQKEEGKEEQKEEGKEEQKDKTESDKFSEYYTGWKPLDLQVSGRIIHKKMFDGRHQIELLGVQEEDIDKVLDKIWGKKEEIKSEEEKEENENEENENEVKGDN